MNMSTKRRLQPRRRGSQLLVALLLCTAALFSGFGANSMLAQPLELDAPDLSVTVKEGTAFTIDTGIPFDALYKVQPTNVTPNTPGHGNVSGLPNAVNGNFALNYTPDPFYSGPDTFFYHFCLADGTQECYDPGEVTVTVTPVNNTPVATDDTAEVDEDSSVNIAVLGNDTAGPAGSGESQTLTIINVAVPASGEATTNGSTITYSPDPDYCNDGTPTDDFTYTVRDDTSIDGTAKTATATVRVTVNCVNDAPTADDIDASTDENTATTFGITGNDNDGVGQALTIVSVTQPAYGKVMTATTTSLTYTPDPYYCNDGDPVDNFTYTIEDDDTFGTSTALSATATVSMTVNCVYDKPIIIIQPHRDDEGDVIVDDHMMHADIILVSHYENVTGLDFMVTYPRCEMNPVVTEGPGEDFYFASQIETNGLHVIIGPDLTDQTPILAGPAISTPVATVATVKFTFDPNCFPTAANKRTGQADTAVRVDQYNPKYSDEFANSMNTGNAGEGGYFRSPQDDIVQGNGIPGPIALSGTDVPENVTGAFVGFLSTTDPDTDDTHTYQLVNCSGVTEKNQNLFTIVDDRYVKLASGQSLSGIAPLDSALLCIQSTDNYGGYVQETFSINVTSVNQPPQAVDDPESGFGGYTLNDFIIQAPTELPVLANDHDPDGDTTFSISAVTQPTHGMVVNNGTDVTYIPTDPTFRGPTAEDSFTYTILDDGGLSDSAQVTVIVNPDAAPGDCNIHVNSSNNPNVNNGVDIGDITALGLEFFDDDDNSNWYATLDDIPFEGDPYGCDANQDTEIGIPDLICIGILFFGGDCGDTVLAASTTAPATLTAGSADAAAPGATVDIPIILGTSGNNVVGAGFAIKIDTAAVSFDSTDSDGDGLPDAFKASAPEGVIVTATYDEENKQIEVIFYTLPPFTALQDGTLATVTLTVNEDINVDTTTVTLTNSSFSNERAQAVPVDVTNGAIQIVVEGQSPASILYLPSIQR